MRVMIDLERVYEPSPRRAARRRFLVERLWPRGMRKEDVHADAWLKDAAPSDGLRKWFGHDPTKWAEFRRRYARELDEHPEGWAPVAEAARRGRVTLLFSSRDVAHNNALALKQYVEKKLSATSA